MKNYLKKIKKLPSRIDREIETVKYKNDKFAGKLRILNVEDSLSYIEKNSNISFYRYGDGEIAIMMGEGIAFQAADEKLAKRLVELLKPNPQMSGLKVAIPYYYLNYEHGLIDFVENFAYAMKVQRRFLIDNCDSDYVYLDTGISQIYQSYAEYDFDNYFNRVRNLFKGRKVTLICGKGIFKNIQYNLLDKCDAVEYMEAPNKNAFSEYDEILKKALTIPRNNLVCIVLGPTAKPLTYDLFMSGYQVWDIGHFIKDYDAWRKHSARDGETIAEFYRPD
jgi:glycosyltransferase family protein